MGTATLVRREMSHIGPLLIDGFTWTMIPTCTFISTKTEGWTQTWLQAFVIFMGALSGFRSKAFGEWRDGKRQRDATELMGKTTTAAEGHLR